MKLTKEAKDEVTKILGTNVWSGFIYGPEKKGFELQTITNADISLKALLALSDLFGTIEISPRHHGEWSGCESGGWDYDEEINITIMNPTKGVK